MSASLPFRRDLDCLSHSVHNSYRGHDRSFVSFTGHHGTRHRAFTDGTGLVLT
ncbi:pyridoxal-dependent decarboxylase, partial [Burkholderia cenocepacia]